MDIVQPDDTLTYLGVELCGAAHLVETQNPCHYGITVGGGEVFVHRDGVFHQFLAVFDIFPLLASEILVKTVLRFGGDHEIIPFFLGVLAVGGQDLYLVAALQLVG